MPASERQSAARYCSREASAGSRANANASFVTLLALSGFAAFSENANRRALLQLRGARRVRRRFRLKMMEVERFEMTPRPVERERYFVYALKTRGLAS